MLDKVRQGLGKIFNVSIVTSVIILVLGIFLFISADLIIRMISVILGVIILVPGVTSLVDYFKTKTNTSLIMGVITIIIALILMINTTFVASVLPFILGIYFVITGISRLQYALELKKSGSTNYTKSLFVSILIMVCGILFIINPFGGAIAITQVMGIFMIIYAILDLSNSVIIKRELREMTRAAGMKNAVIEVKAEEKND